MHKGKRILCIKKRKLLVRDGDEFCLGSLNVRYSGASRLKYKQKYVRVRKSMVYPDKYENSVAEQ